MQWPKRMRGNASEQCPALVGAKQPGQHRGGKHRRCTEPGQCDRVPGNAQQRTHDVLGQHVESLRSPIEQGPPAATIGAQPVGRLAYRTVQHARAAVIERMHAVDIGQQPAQAVAVQVQAGEELRADGHRMDGRTVVMHQAGHDGLAAAGTAAHLLGGLENGDLQSGFGQGDGGGEPIGPATNHDRGLRCTFHASAPCSRSCPSRIRSRLPPSDQVTCVGIGPLGSHGCSATASATFQVPRSSTPRAASMTL